MYYVSIKSKLKTYPLINSFLICLNCQLYRYATNMKIVFFTTYFFECGYLRFSVLILTIIREETMSQIFYIWPSFYFKHCRKYY